MDLRRKLSGITITYGLETCTGENGLSDVLEGFTRDEDGNEGTGGHTRVVSSVSLEERCVSLVQYRDES